MNVRRVAPTGPIRLALVWALAAAPLCGAQDALVLTVVPFRTQAPAEHSYLGESFSETLATKLVGVRGIRLYERSQFSRVADELKLEMDRAEFFDPDTVSRVGKVVAIDYMLLGSAQLAGSGLALNVRLVNVNSGRALLAREFRGRFPEDPFSLQDQAALAVAKSLELRLSELDLRSLSRRPTADPDAYALYNSSLASKDDRERIALLERAAARDPAFSQAQNLLADLYEKAGRYADARAAYGRLLAADPSDYRAAYNLALLLLDEGMAAQARTSLGRCLELKGEEPDALYHLGYSWEFGSDGSRFGPGHDLSAARDWYCRARAADPRHREALYALGVTAAALAQASQDPQVQLARVRESRDALGAYLSAYPDSENRDEIEENLLLLQKSEESLLRYLGTGGKGP